MAAKRKTQPAAQPQLVPAAPGTAIAPIDRARQILKLDERKAQLVDLTKDSARIVEIKDAAGYQECHSARMRLKGTRVDIEKAGKEARDDANKFSKAVIGVENELVAIISPEEQRLQKLQDAWDAAREAERQEKARIERERIEAEQAALRELRDLPAASISRSAQLIRERIAELESEPLELVPEGVREQWIALRTETIAQLNEIAESKEKQEAEAKRLADERAELERQRKQRDEEDRARAAAEQKQREADAATEREQLRKERAEHEANLAAERKRLDEERAELYKAREEQRKRDQEEADRKAAAERKRLDDEAAAERERQQKAADEERERRERDAEKARQAEAEARAARLDELKTNAPALLTAAIDAHRLLVDIGQGDEDITLTLGFAIERANANITRKAA